jgi:hypothetical protein
MAMDFEGGKIAMQTPQRTRKKVEPGGFALSAG